MKRKNVHTLGNPLKGGTKGKLQNLRESCKSRGPEGKIQKRLCFSADKQLTGLSPDQSVGAGIQEKHTQASTEQRADLGNRGKHTQDHLAMFSLQHQGAEAPAKIPERGKGLAEVRMC